MAIRGKLILLIFNVASSIAKILHTIFLSKFFHLGKIRIGTL